MPFLRTPHGYALITFGLFLLAFAGCASAPRSASHTYDVIVVGAGLAGLTVAKDLIRGEHSVLVLEATDRIGGRAVTDLSFAVPVDFGAAWIHGADKNPLTALVDWLQVRRVATNLYGPVFIGNRRLTPEEMQAYLDDQDATEKAMACARTDGKDLSAAEFLPPRSDYRALIAANIGPLESGASIEATSSADSAAFQTDPDDFVAEGIGTFVATLGQGVPVQLNSPVTAIHYGAVADQGVVVKVSGGQSYRARRVVVTVSNGVLAAGGIAFQPELPSWKLQAISALPMGLLNKVVLQFTDDVFADEGDNAWVLHQQSGQREGAEPAVMAFVIKPLGANIAVGFYGADQARQFETLGDAAAIAHAKAALGQMYGAEVVARIDDSATKVTRWGQHPWTLGSYTSALPGASDMHAEMARPVNDRVFFAGEACGPAEYNGSLAAAYVSGLRASRWISDSLAREDQGRVALAP